MFPEEHTHWGYAIYRHGTLVSTGPNPIPEEYLAEATEIRWVRDDPATLSPS